MRGNPIGQLQKRLKSRSFGVPELLDIYPDGTGIKDIVGVATRFPSETPVQ
jgi:hypothetical protein